MSFPMRHVSIRVPWHDTGWDGRVCANPRLNGSCLKLKGIGESRNDAAEEAVAGRSLQELPQAQWPCCMPERVGFMAPFELTRIANHPYNRGPDCAHGHFEDAQSGRNYYWEHCGMLHVPNYRRRWELKLAWYKANGILPREEGGGPNGTLIVTRDETNGSIDSSMIVGVIDEVFGD